MYDKLNCKAYDTMLWALFMHQQFVVIIIKERNDVIKYKDNSAKEYKKILKWTMRNL